MSKERGQGIVGLALALMLACLIACFILCIIGEGEPVEAVKKLWDALQKGGALSTAFGGGMVVIPPWLSAKPPLRCRIKGFFWRLRALWRMKVVPLPFGYWADISIAHRRICIVDALTGEVIPLRRYLEIASALWRLDRRKLIVAGPRQKWEFLGEDNRGTIVRLENGRVIRILDFWLP